MVKVLKN